MRNQNNITDDNSSKYFYLALGGGLAIFTAVAYTAYRFGQRYSEEDEDEVCQETTKTGGVVDWEKDNIDDTVSKNTQNEKTASLCGQQSGK